MLYSNKICSDGKVHGIAKALNFTNKCLQSWVAKKSCHGQTPVNECSIFDYHSNFEGL